MSVDRRAALRNLGLLLCAGSRLGAARAEEKVDEAARAEIALANLRREADEYRLRYDQSDSPTFQRRPEAVLRWSNPGAGSIHGVVFVWTHQGRPEAIASFYQWFHPFTHRSHEFASLSVRPLVAEREGATAWAPHQPGVRFKPMPDAPQPGATPAVRLRQMRELARGFTATERLRETKAEPAPKVFSLRPLAKPIYRYTGTTGDLIDGALFAFVQGTDPELILLVEAQRTDGRPQWQFALARLNSTELRSQYKGRDVFATSVLPWAVVRDHQQPYFTVQFR